MNANRYRLIFDQRTGMLVPVAEFTSSAKKGNSRGAGDGMGDTSTPKWSTLCIAMALAAGGGAPRAAHAQMVPDGTTQTTVTQTSSGVPLVNIANPNANGGLSHNKFTTFNLDARGAVFNNSQVDANTRIGGQALKNPHLAGNASAILAEITGNNTSHLLGTMEVHGAPADLIIANPNGIFANGVSILGANNLTLTTGTPDAQGRKFEIRGGEVEIGAPDGIAREMIVGAYKVNVDGVVPDSFMPNPNFEAEFDRAKLAELNNELAHLHRDTWRTRDDMLANGNTNGARMADETLGRVEDYFLEVMEHQKKGARLEADRRGFRTTELYKDPYKNRVVIATDMEDPNVTRAASRLRLKHFGNSVVVAPEDGTLRTLMGDADDLQGGPMKVQVVGEHRADGTIGGRTPEEIAQYVADAKRQFGGEVAKVTLVSCDTAACGKTQLRAALADMRLRMGGKSALVDALESMSQDIGGHDTVDDVVKALRTHGIDANVVGREGAVIVERDGSKQAVPHGTAGALGVPESSREFTEATLKE